MNISTLIYNIHLYKNDILTIKCSQKRTKSLHFCKEKMKFYSFTGNKIVEPTKYIDFINEVQGAKEYLNSLLFQTDLRIYSSYSSFINKFNNKKSRELGVVVNKELISRTPSAYKNSNSANTSLNYYFNKYGTKKLSEKLFFSNNKVIIKYIKELVNNDQSVTLLYNFLKSDKNYEQLFVTLIQKDPTQSKELLMHQILTGAKKPLEESKLGSSYSNYLSDEISQMLQMKKQLSCIEDEEIQKMYTSEYKKILKKRESTTHESFSVELRTLSRKISHRHIEFAYTEKEVDTFTLEDDEHIISLAKSNTELDVIGSTMSICVGSYSQRVEQGSCDIITVKSKTDDKYLVCLELIDKKYIVQAKMYCNTRLKENYPLLSKVQMYAQDRRLDINTRDMR